MNASFKLLFMIIVLKDFYTQHVAEIFRGMALGLLMCALFFAFGYILPRQRPKSAQLKQRLLLNMVSRIEW